MLHGQFPGRILQSAREALACRELPKELVESNTYAVMVLNKPSSSSFVAALCSEDEREARTLRLNPRRKIDC
jgi:hypothetical protein